MPEILKRNRRAQIIPMPDKFGQATEGRGLQATPQLMGNAWAGALTLPPIVDRFGAEVRATFGQYRPARTVHVTWWVRASGAEPTAAPRRQGGTASPFTEGSTWWVEEPEPHHDVYFSTESEASLFEEGFNDLAAVLTQSIDARQSASEKPISRSQDATPPPGPRRRTAFVPGPTAIVQFEVKGDDIEGPPQPVQHATYTFIESGPDGSTALMRTLQRWHDMGYYAYREANRIRVGDKKGPQAGQNVPDTTTETRKVLAMSIPAQKKARALARLVRNGGTAEDALRGL